MGYQNNYGGIIFTNHALRRMYERGIVQDLAWDTVKHPENVLKGKKAETVEYQKKVDSSQVSVIAVQNRKKEIVVLSVIANPPLKGTISEKQKQAYREYQKASWWKKLFLTFKNQIFG